MSQDDFGKDLGLVHQAVVTGRKVGADRAFWACLAHHPSILKRVVEEVKTETTFNDADKVAIREWARVIRKSDPPYKENDSYYSPSSASLHSWELDYIARQSDMRQLFWKAQFRSDAAAVCAKVELCFQVAYFCSGLYWCCLHKINARERHPVWELERTFSGLLQGQRNIPLGIYLTFKQFKEDEYIPIIVGIIDDLLECRGNPPLLISYFKLRGAGWLGRSKTALEGVLDNLFSSLD